MRFNSNTRPIRQKQLEKIRDKPGVPPPPFQDAERKHSVQMVRNKGRIDYGKEKEKGKAGEKRGKKKGERKGKRKKKKPVQRRKKIEECR